MPGSYLAVIFFIIDDDYKLNVLFIRHGRPGWHAVITGAVSPLTECAPIGDRTPMGRFCQITHQHKIGYSVETS